MGKAASIYTFYSFKGGVGRSMAMANIAELLRRKKRVVIIDWDLEAPGLEGYFYSSATELEEKTVNDGLIDLLESYKAEYLNYHANHPTGIGPQADERSITEIVEYTISELSNKITESDINGLVAQVRQIVSHEDRYLIDEVAIKTIANELHKLFDKEELDLSVIAQALQHMVPAQAGTSQAAKRVNDIYVGMKKQVEGYLQIVRADVNPDKGLWILTAGKRAKEYFSGYVDRVQKFSYAEFIQLYDGKLFFECFRKALVQFVGPEGVVLIDSRTGLTEMGGVCTRLLADTVVLLTAPNPQNLAGVAEMVRSINNKEVINMRDRPIRTLVIPSRLDITETQEQHNFQLAFLRIMSAVLSEEIAKECIKYAIPYIPINTYYDMLVIGAEDILINKRENTRKSIPLEKAYIKLAEYIHPDETTVKDDKIDKNEVPATPPAPATPPQEAVNPYGNAGTFLEKDAVYFFGRTEELATMQRILAKEKMLILSGPSGSGKSSMINAGLIPNLRQQQSAANEPAQGDSAAYIYTFRPGNDPLRRLLLALGHQTEEAGKLSTADAVKRIEQAISRYAQDKITPQAMSDSKSAVLVIDNCEDLFISSSKSDAGDFLRLIGRCVETGLADIVVSVRSEYCIDIKGGFTDQAKFDRSVINLTVGGRDENRKMIEEPAAKAGLRLEQGLAERLLKDIEGARGKMRVLRYALSLLWEQRLEDQFTHKAYDSLPQIDGVLRRMAENAMKILGPAKLERLRHLLARLVNSATGQSQAVDIRGLDKDRLEALGPLVDQGIIVIGYDNSTGGTLMDLSHPGLASNWAELVEWQKSDASFVAWRENLNADIQKWTSKNAANEFLLKGKQLQKAKEEAQRRDADLLQYERKYIIKSTSHNRKNITNNTVIFGVVLLCIIATAWYFIRENEKSRRLNDTRIEYLSDFKSRLHIADSLHGSGQARAICDLANEQPEYPGDYIDSVRKELKLRCDTLTALVRIQSSAAGLDNAISILAKPTLQLKSLSKTIDNLDKQIQIKTFAIANATNDFERTKLIQDTARLALEVSKIIAVDTTFVQASIKSNELQKNYVQQDSFLRSAKSARPKGSTRSGWFKEGFYLQFDSVRIFLSDLNRSQNSINVEICNQIGNAPCRDPQKPSITAGAAYSFPMNQKNYILYLDRIGRGGKNPFTLCAYITLIQL